MSREDELRQQIAALYDELHGIERAKKTHQAKSLVGRCFRYQNSYGCAGTDDDGEIVYWPLYVLIVSDSKVLKFQIDMHGQVKVEMTDLPFPQTYIEDSGWVEIEREELDEEWETMLATLALMRPSI